MKKLLYILASVFLAFIIMLNVIYSNFYSVFQGFTSDAVAQKDYTYAERFLSRVMVSDNEKFYAQTHENGMHIEVYSALSDMVRYVYDDNGEKVTDASTGTEQTYYTLENSIQISIFHYPSTFTLQDTTGDNPTTGGIELVFSDGNKVKFGFVTDAINYYDFASNYNYLPLTIAEADYVEALKGVTLAEGAYISGLNIIDGDNDESYSVTFTENYPTFETTFSTAFTSVIEKYNAYQLNATKTGETDSNKSTEITNEYNKVMEDNPTYLSQHSVDIVYGSSEFLVPVILIAVIFLAVDVLLGILLFRKKKPRKFVPPGQKGQTQPQPQPEQFTRDMFDLDPEDVVDVMNNTTPQITTEEKPVEDANSTEEVVE